MRTVRLAEKDQAKLLAALERAGSSFDENANRRRVRVPLNGTVIVMIDGHNGNATKYAVVPRNLSSQGLAFIHGQFVYAKQTCRVVLPTLRGQWVAVKGTVLHARHIGGIIHEVAVRFAETIDLAQFVGLTPEQDERHKRERVRSGLPAEGPLDPGAATGRLQGHVLLVDSLEVDRRLFAVWLGGQGLSIGEAATPAKAIEQFERVAPTIVLIDVRSKQGDGLEFARELRKRGYAGPIAAVSSDEAEATQAAVMAAGCNAFLAKPCARPTFVQMIEQLLNFDPALSDPTSQTPIVSSLAGDAQMAGMIEKFVAGLGPSIESLAAAKRSGDVQALQTVCQELKGSGSAYGLPPLTQMSRLALGQLQASTPDLVAVGRAIDDLIAIAKRVRVK
ncbi:MAG: response regulator [Planctomycetota bacterium]|nr:response regulator [Planctomycetota bacterium]